jgi:hypothetical protein
MDVTAEKLAGMNDRLDDMLSELGALRDIMPDEDDFDDLQNYNKPVKLPPLKETKKKQNHNKQSSDQQPYVIGNKKME